jgi:hypothetical protein
MKIRFFRWFLLFVCLVGLSGEMRAEDEVAVEEEAKEQKEEPKAKLSDDGTVLELPGVKVMLKEKYVDVDAKVCLTDGLLELAVCAKDTKNHESVFSLETKAELVHAALLLINVKPGNPAMRKPVEGKEGMWVDIEPRGDEVNVFVVVKDAEGKAVERPLSDFIKKAGEDFHGIQQPDKEEEKKEPLPTHTFLFAGSHVWEEEGAPAKYLADVDGNVISLSTFGDEMLCLPGVHSHGNEALAWQVDSTHLPPLDTPVILRLRPKLAEKNPEEK